MNANKDIGKITYVREPGAGEPQRHRERSPERNKRVQQMVFFNVCGLGRQHLGNVPEALGMLPSLYRG
jgi:hypothetical protein